MVTVLWSIAIPSVNGGRQQQPENASAAKAHNLAIASFSYANDNNQTYPTGSTSTAIFQKLFEGKYLIQPADVFLTTKGGKFSKPEDEPLTRSNVSWDYVTESNAGLTDSDPADIPILYSCVASEPTWTAGINEVEIDQNCPWGTHGVTMVTLSQVASFERAKQGDEVALTTAAFLPEKGVTYITRTP
jgi:hypothetical protein